MPTVDSFNYQQAENHRSIGRRLNNNDGIVTPQNKDYTEDVSEVDTTIQRPNNHKTFHILLENI